MDLPANAHDASRLARELDWNLLRTFVVIAEAPSITAAAERLRLKQPTVSAALARLESRLGKRLVDRKPGTFRLTPTGEALYREALEIQGAVIRIATAIRDVHDEVRGHVRIVMASHVVCPVLDESLRRFHEAHPRATLSIDIMRSRDAVADVLARRASFAVCLVHKRSPRLAYRRLYREFFGLFCGPAHPFFGRDDLQLSDLAGQRFGEADDAGLGRRVVRLPRIAHDTHHRGDADDAPAPLLHHAAQTGLAHAVHP